MNHYIVFLVLIFSGSGGLAQHTHPVTVSVNQPGECIPVTVNGTGGDESFIRIFPNPAHHLLTIESALSGGTILLSDVTGRIASGAQLEPGVHTIDIRPFPRGLYILTVTDRTGIRFFKVVFQ